MGKLDGKVAAITGAASGIGRRTAEVFVAEGARVVISDVQDGPGEALAAELGEGAIYLHADVTEEADVEALVHQAVASHGGLDCLFNNAGAPGATGPIEEISVAGFDQAMALLVRSVFLGIKHAAPVMKQQKSGSIISTASVAGLQAGYGPHPYSAAKAAVIQLTRSVAMELGEQGVRVNCICPGFIATPIFARALGLPADRDADAAAAAREVLAASQPMPRAGLAEDVAAAALWLASDDASFVTGHALVVDGGLTGGQKWSARRARMAMLAAALGAET